MSNPGGDTIHMADDVESGQFVFVAEAAGRYTACFWSPLFKPGGDIEVDFDWKTGISAADRSRQVAKKGKINVGIYPPLHVALISY